MPKTTDVNEIYDRIQKDVDIDSDELQSKIAGWLTGGTSEKLTSGKKSLVSDIFNKYSNQARDNVDKFVNRNDIVGLKKFQFEDKQLQTIRDNQLYNLAGTLYREARDSRDISGLERLKENIRGTTAESDWTPDIDKAIERLRR